MIQETKTYHCRTYGSTNIVKNGTNHCGNQQYWCKDCGARRVLAAKRETLVKKSAEPEDLPRTQQYARRGASAQRESPDLQSLVGRTLSQLTAISDQHQARPGG